MDFGFVSHSVHMNSRLVWLVVGMEGDVQELRVTSPPNEQIYPPGPGWFFVLINGIPSEGFKVMVGPREPPVDQAAIDK